MSLHLLPCNYPRSSFSSLTFNWNSFQAFRLYCSTFQKPTANKREPLRFKTRFTYSISGVLNQPQPLCLTIWQMEPLRTQDIELQSVWCGKDRKTLWWKLVFSLAHKETYFGKRGETQVTCLRSQNELSEPWHQESGLLSYTPHRKTIFLTSPSEFSLLCPEDWDANSLDIPFRTPSLKELICGVKEQPNQ